MDCLSQELLLSDGTMEDVLSYVRPELNEFLKSKPPFQAESDLLGPVELQNINMQYLSGENFIMADSTEILGYGGTIDIPSPTCALPCFEDYPGSLDFDVMLDYIGSNKPNGEYSEKLKKIYVTMGTKIPFLFKWNNYDANLYVRALPIYLFEESRADPVKRCPSHCSENEKSNTGFQHVHHIIRCDDMRTTYDQNQESGRLSVVVPLDPPQPGSKGTTVMFSFMCKNSCALGMNRRATGLIFTLETENGTVVGRRAMKLRICSCPKRDRKKEEAYEQVDTEPTELVIPEGKKLISKKKPLKRLVNNEQQAMITLSIPVLVKRARPLLRVIREVISMPLNYRELTEGEKMTVDACNKLEQSNFE